MKKNIFGDDVKRVHFIGIGGISMSGLAEMLMARGFAVSGSDDNVSDATERLGSLGIKIYTAHEAANLNDCPDLVVYTAAIKNGNSELAAARSKNIRVIDRAELLGLMINENDSSVCIAGCHGKTTTTSIVADICVGAGYDPSVNVGGYMQSSGKNFRAGSTGCMIAEACEYSDSFLKFYPRIGVILNIEEDHMDYFKTKKNLYASYRKFAENIKPGGALIIYGGIPGIEEVTLGLGCRVITYGTENANYMARNISRAECGSTEFDIFFNGVFFVHAKLRLRGGHNILNALAAAAAVRELG
ncbi:MAG: Mur ligase family protein, partial [Defluviitaleaceae bacterium]|nr:Mur ligase family protein [Defluviitaleaceae bacterium]